MFVYYFRSGEVSLGRVLNSPTELGPSPLAGVTHLEKTTLPNFNFLPKVKTGWGFQCSIGTLREITRFSDTISP